MAKKNKSRTTIGLVDAYRKQPTSVPPRRSTYKLKSTRTENLIQKATKIANQNFTETHKKPINNNRKALIEEAMSMRKAKSHILDQLDQEQLRKLSNMAGRAFDQNAAE